MAVTLTQLRTFAALAEAGSVRAAAERLYVSQPSVSAAVASLEREIGAALLERHGRGVRLTAAGRAFAGKVRESLGLLDQAVRSAQSTDQPGRGTVRLASVTTAAEHLVMPLVAGFRRENPFASVTVEVGNRTTVWAALRDRQADLVIAGRPPAAVAARVLGKAANQLVVVGAVGDGPPPATRGALAWLAGRTWLLREEGSGTRDATESLLDELGIRPRTMILGSNGAVESGVSAGLGVALVPYHSVASALQEGRLAVLPCPGTPIERPWHLVSHAGDRPNPTASTLIRSMLAVDGGFAPTAEGRKVLARKAER